MNLVAFASIYKILFWDVTKEMDVMKINQTIL